MERTTVSFTVGIFVLVAITSHHATSVEFHCDIPTDWMVRPENFFPGNSWPDGVVPYELNTTLTAPDIVEVRTAFADIESKTCIRFIPREEDDISFVSIEHDDTVCGLANVCQVGGYQFARFGGGCTFSNAMVHELGHTLCLLHDHQRFDRDEFVDFSTCSADEIQPKENFDTRGFMYDYTSEMHYQCVGCLGGRPLMPGVTQCGIDVQNGFSVLDTDKINDLYNCPGCLSHRWRRVENLTDAQRGQLVSFGKTGLLNDLYLCRTYAGNGEIAPGQYNIRSNTCTVTMDGTVFHMTDKFQVFTVPNRVARRRYISTETVQNFVKVGRTKDAVTIYAAVSTRQFEGCLGISERHIGKIYSNDLSKAYFAAGESVVITPNYEGIGCN